MFGGQDCHAEAAGAFTGDVSAEMLRDAGAKAVIVGHSERRQLHGETDAVIAAKATAAWRAGLIAIICIGETLAEREAGQAEAVCKKQLSGSVPSGATIANTAIAYEPVWAIGTGKTPTSAEIAAMHAHIRACLGSEPANSLRRVSETVQREGNSGASECRRGTCWGCQPQGFRFHYNCRGFARRRLTASTYRSLTGNVAFVTRLKLLAFGLARGT